MALKEIAVDGMDFDFVSSSDSGDLTLTGSPSIKVKAEDNGVYKNTLGISVSNFENDNVQAGSGAGVFVATGTKTKADGLLVLRVDDLAIIAGTGTNKNAPPPTLPFVTTVEITDANQTKVKGE
jgi:hypothetical protein